MRALCRQIPKVGAECLNWARSDLCGGRPAMDVPTANTFGGVISPALTCPFALPLHLRPNRLPWARGAMMNQREPNLVRSGLSGTVTKDGVTVEVSIVRLENETSWSLEVVNSSATSTVWDDLFLSDEDAYVEFQRTVAEEGIKTFLDRGNVIPLKR
jgi:hypothetical protein